MTDDKIRPDPSNQAEPTALKQSSQGAQRPQSGIPDAPAQSTAQSSAPGRKPLFRS
jgi:hypothetical protein